MTARKKGGLGKGLNNLIPDGNAKKGKIEKKEYVNGATEKKESLENKNPIMLRVTEIEPNRSQPRKKFNEDALQELADSIKQFGIIQPLVVQKREDYYEIIAGERRWRAAKIADIKEVPVIIKDYSEQEIVEIALIENIQREDLNPIEEAMAFKRLLEDYHLKQDEIAERISKSRVAVTNSMRLLKLCPKVQQMVIDEMITSGHARCLIGIEDEEQQYNLAMKIFDEKLSVRETEKLIKNFLNPKEKKVKEVNLQDDIIYQDIENKIKSIVGTNVKINRKQKNKGKIEIEYYSSDELERLIEMFMSLQ